ncbi:MAG: DciA family protein, partial [bacterium]
MNPPRLDRVLVLDTDLGPVVQKAQDLGALSRHCLAALPPQLAAQVRGFNVRNGKLTVLVANSAAGAKLKLHSVALCQQAAKMRVEVNSVSVRVQPSKSRIADAASHKSAQLSAATLARLTALHEQMGDSAAKQALAAL